MTFPRGYRANPQAHRLTRAKYRATRVAAAPAEWLELVPVAVECSPAWLQTLSSCTGHGSADGVNIAFAAAGAPLPFRCSPAEAYRNGRAIDRIFVGGRPTTDLKDEGARPWAVIKAVNTIGVCPTKAADGVSSDDDEATVNDEAMLGTVEVERQTVPIGEYGIPSVGEGASLAEVVTNVKAALASSLPVGLGCNAEGPFQTWTGPTAYTPPADAPPPDHWVILIGYRQNAAGRTEFLLKNSWGADWGCSVTHGGRTLFGCMWVSEAFLATCDDLTVYVPELAA